ncbi:MAG: M48 family metalloprotease [Helicobacteraceae bacterium]|jgi:Zn-dependent protease with chaperone function|nr:M48 family metalloprotease [Helicobacteraceae bacterium]
MNFRERQRLAKRNSRRLIAYFTASVFSVVFFVWYLSALLYGLFETDLFSFNPIALFITSPFSLNFGVLAIVCATIGLGAYSIARNLKGDGNAVAKILGASAIVRSGANASERRLLNIVEEMALASGILPPSVYVLPQNKAINALTAGESQANAAIVVTSGALIYLNRDELQGVIAHEFSHILNEDVKLNMRSAFLLGGVEFTLATGAFFMRSQRDDVVMRHEDILSPGADSPRQAWRFLFGAVLYICSAIGMVCASIVKSALNREREFLADASTVQFARQTDGIAGALKKIGGLSSNVNAPLSSMFSHFFFAEGPSGILDSHPPIEERIRRIEPKWDGSFIAPIALTEAETSEANYVPAPTFADGGIYDSLLPLANPNEGIIALKTRSDAKAKANAIEAQYIPIALKSNDAPQKALDALSIARENIEAISDFLREQASEALSARWIIYALLIDAIDEAIAKRQIAILNSRVFAEDFCKIQLALSLMKRENVVHLIFLCVPALERLTFDQYTRFKEIADLLIEEDGKISLFEFNLKYLVFYPLDIAFNLRKPPKPIHFGFYPIAKEISAILSAIAYDQFKNDSEAKAAFDRLCGERSLEYVSAKKMLSQTLELAYNAVQQANDDTKKLIIEKAIECVKADGAISIEEIETIHALRSAFGFGYL